MQNVACVRFVAGGAHPFFREPVNQLRGEHIPLDAIWRDADSVRARMLEAATPEARLRTLEAILRERLVRPLARDPAIDQAVACFTNPVRVWRIAEVQDRLGMTAKRFIRSFAEHVGLTPKRFARVCRFQRALAELDQTRRSLAEIAAGCGYFDQTHFNHEFRAFAGATPSEHRARRYRVHNRVDQPKIYNPAPRRSRILAR